MGRVWLMRKAMELVKEILLTPLRVILSILWGIGTNLPFIVSHIGNIFHQDLDPYWEGLMKSNLFSFLSQTWWIFLLMAWFFLIAFGIYRKARYYLGDRIRTRKITLISGCDTIEEKPIAFIIIKNDENLDLDDCSASITIKVKIDGKWVNKTQEFNPNYSSLCWPLFTKNEKKVIGSGRGGRINVAAYIPNSFAFTFEDGNKPTCPFTDWQYYIEVKVSGYLNKIPIEVIEWHGFIRYKTEIKDISREIISVFGNGLKNEVVSGKEKPIDIPDIVAIRLYLEPGKLNEKQCRPAYE